MQKLQPSEGQQSVQAPPQPTAATASPLESNIRRCHARPHPAVPMHIQNRSWSLAAPKDPIAGIAGGLATKTFAAATNAVQLQLRSMHARRLTSATGRHHACTPACKCVPQSTGRSGDSHLMRPVCDSDELSLRLPLFLPSGTLEAIKT